MSEKIAKARLQIWYGKDRKELITGKAVDAEVSIIRFPLTPDQMAPGMMPIIDCVKISITLRQPKLWDPKFKRFMEHPILAELGPKKKKRVRK